MKRVSILTATLLAVAVVQAWATPTVPCSTSDMNLGTILSTPSFSCEVGDKIFSNFTYTSSSSGAIALPSSAVTVDTLGPLTGTDPADLLSSNIGLQFSAGWTASSVCSNSAGCTGAETDSLIGFTVTVVGGSNMVITDLGLTQTSAVTGTGSLAQVDENACGPASCTPGTLSVHTFDNGSNSGTLRIADTIINPGLGSVQVQQDINVLAGATWSANAGLSAVTDTFSQSPSGVPEPATMLLVGGALCGLAAIRRRSAKR